ncbi:MAG TPA: class I SAM-dependent methyltransferase [Chlorobaculum sp.]|nr:class I SAM-dependent methyltransferase [Chlorobaculum sp.]
MHHSALKNSQEFYDCYSPFFGGDIVRVVEIGAQNVNGSIRDACPENFEYTGIDFVAGNGVDIVLDDPYKLPLNAESADIVVSSSCFEHAEMFWVLFLEIMRILKPRGLFYLNAPSNGSFHRYPVDCWRFYPDSGKALEKWARHNHLDTVLLESYVSDQTDDQWNDFVAVFLKDEGFLSDFPKRIVEQKEDFNNGVVYGSSELMKPIFISEDVKKLLAIELIIKKQIKINMT